MHQIALDAVDRAAHELKPGRPDLWSNGSMDTVCCAVFSRKADCP
jgi:hypothetical protein